MTSLKFLNGSNHESHVLPQVDSSLSQPTSACHGFGIQASCCSVKKWTWCFGVLDCVGSVVGMVFVPVSKTGRIQDRSTRPIEIMSVPP